MTSTAGDTPSCDARPQRSVAIRVANHPFQLALFSSQSNEALSRTFQDLPDAIQVYIQSMERFETGTLHAFQAKHYLLYEAIGIGLRSPTPIGKEKMLQSYMLCSIISAYRLMEELVLMSEVPPSLQAPSLSPKRTAIRMKLLVPLNDVVGLVQAFCKSVNSSSNFRIEKPEESGPFCHLMTLTQLQEKKATLKIYTNLTVVALHLAFLLEVPFDGPLPDLPDSAEKYMIALRNLSDDPQTKTPEKLSNGEDMLQNIYIEGAEKDRTNLRSALQLMVMISPLCLFIPIELHKKQWNRGEINEAAILLGNSRPTELRKIERLIFKTIYRLALREVDLMTAAFQLSKALSELMQEESFSSSNIQGWFNFVRDIIEPSNATIGAVDTPIPALEPAPLDSMDVDEPGEPNTTASHQQAPPGEKPADVLGMAIDPPFSVSESHVGMPHPNSTPGHLDTAEAQSFVTDPETERGVHPRVDADDTQMDDSSGAAIGQLAEKENDSMAGTDDEDNAQLQQNIGGTNNLRDVLQRALDHNAMDTDDTDDSDGEEKELGGESSEKAKKGERCPDGDSDMDEEGNKEEGSDHGEDDEDASDEEGNGLDKSAEGGNAVDESTEEQSGIDEDSEDENDKEAGDDQNVEGGDGEDEEEEEEEETAPAVPGKRGRKRKRVSDSSEQSVKPERRVSERNASKQKMSYEGTTTTTGSSKKPSNKNSVVDKKAPEIIRIFDSDSDSDSDEDNEDNTPKVQKVENLLLTPDCPIHRSKKGFTIYGPTEDSSISFFPIAHSEADLKLMENLLEAVVECYVDGKPLHLVDPNESAFRVLTSTTFDGEDIRDLQKTFSKQNVIVHDLPLQQIVEFDEAGFYTLVPSLDERIDIQDLSVTPKAGDYNDRLKKGTPRQILQAHRQVDGKILNALNFPGSVLTSPGHPLSSDLAAWGATSWRRLSQDEEYPVRHMRWFLAATKGAMHLWHIDSNGACTFVTSKNGPKCWIVAFRKAGHSEEAFSDIRFFLPPFDITKVCKKKWRLEAIILGPGTVLNMRPNTPHAVITVRSAICEGGHFYAESTLQQTAASIMHTFVTGSVTTNTNHDATRPILRRMAELCYLVLIRNKLHDNPRILAHVPTLDNMNSVLNLLSLCNLVILANVLDGRTYLGWKQDINRKRTSQEDHDLKTHDRNALSVAEREKYRCARGMCLQILLWFAASFEVTAKDSAGGLVQIDDVLHCLVFSYLVQQGRALLAYKKAAQKHEISGFECTVGELSMQLNSVFSVNAKLKEMWVSSAQDQDTEKYRNLLWSGRKDLAFKKKDGVKLSGEFKIVDFSETGATPLDRRFLAFIQAFGGKK